MNKKLLIISSYPEKGEIHGKKTVGVAPYTKNVLSGMLEAAKLSGDTLALTVLAEELSDQSKSYHEFGIQINRVWKRNDVGSWLKLLRVAGASPQQNVLIAFELAMFGGSLSLLFFPLLLALLRLSGKNVTVMAHHVVTDLEAVQGHLNLKKGVASNKLGNVFLRLFYWLMVVLAHKVVVFDEALQEQLSRSNKVVVIPHGVEQARIVATNKQAREKLGVKEDEFLLVSFGYLAWYKGTDWLVEAVQALPDVLNGKKVRLIIAGGPNPYRETYAFYREYVAKLETIAAQSKGKIQITGYVPEDEIGLYYQAADCLVYPYRTVFSASGPLSLAFSYKKPFLLADSMAKIAKTEDFAQALKKVAMTMSDITFTLSAASFQLKLSQMINKSEYRKKLVNIANILAGSRSFTVIGKEYLSLED